MDSMERFEPTLIAHVPEWAELHQQEVARRRFWWGGKGKPGFLWQTLAIRFFLSMSEPSFRSFKTVS